MGVGVTVGAEVGLGEGLAVALGSAVGEGGAVAVSWVSVGSGGIAREIGVQAPRSMAQTIVTMLLTVRTGMGVRI
jgi:hypothetical protein